MTLFLFEITVSKVVIQTVNKVLENFGQVVNATHKPNFSLAIVDIRNPFLKNLQRWTFFSVSTLFL